MFKTSVSINREKADAGRNRRVSFRRDRGDAGSRNASLMLISQYLALFSCPLPMFLVGPEKQPFHMTDD
jgi:hypothetical protein